MYTTSFFDNKKKQNKKKDNEDLSFTLRNIDLTKIDKEFNMNDMKNIGISSDLVFDEVNEGTSLEKLGISSLKREPITTIVQKEKTKLQTFITMIGYNNGVKLPLKPSIPCFGCHRIFTTVQLGIPIDYHPSIYHSKNDYTKIKNITVNERQKLQTDVSNNIDVMEYFDTDGIVCSFNCMISVIEDNPSPLYKKTPSLIPKMYKMIFGEYPKEKIIKSPNWRLREEYGGPLSDEEFVANLQTIQFTDMHQVDKTLKIMNTVGRVFKVYDINR